MERNQQNSSANSCNQTSAEDDQEGDTEQNRTNATHFTCIRFFESIDNGIYIKKFERIGSSDKIYDPNNRPASYGTHSDSVVCTNLHHHQAQANNNDCQYEKQTNNQVSVSDIIGSFGWFQFLVLLFSGLREGLVGYDALIMSVILQPESEFLCADNMAASQLVDKHPSLANMSLLTTGTWNETAQCYRSLDGGHTPLLDTNHRPIQCQKWLFADETAEKGPSLVAEWSLVCQNHWLVAFIESAYFFGLVTGNLVWGYYADKVGRRPAYLVAHTIGLIFGSLAVVMPSIWLFAVCRFLSAFGSVGYNIIYSIQVELIGTKHRSFSTILNHAGWGLGVIFVPIVDHLFNDYRPIIAVAPILTLAM